MMEDIVERLRAVSPVPLNASFAEKVLIHELKKVFKEAADEIERLRATCNWQPIETAPKGVSVLVWVPAHQVATEAWHCVETDLWPHYEAFNDDGEPCNVGRPTHWMPLPEPPDQGDA